VAHELIAPDPGKKIVCGSGSDSCIPVTNVAIVLGDLVLPGPVCGKDVRTIDGMFYWRRFVWVIIWGKEGHFIIFVVVIIAAIGLGERSFTKKGADEGNETVKEAVNILEHTVETCILRV
jgi:hypothetical protein